MSRGLQKNVVPAPDSYMTLIRRFPLRPIRTESDYITASGILETLAINGEDKLDSGEQDYLAVLTDLVESYDDEKLPAWRDKRPAHEKLKALAREHDISTLELAKILGVSRSLTSLILTGRRRITADHAKALGRHFKLDAGYFL